MATTSNITQGSPNQSLVAIGLILVIAAGYGSFQWLLPNLRTSKQALENAQAKDAGMQTDIDNLQKAQQQLATAKASLAQKGIDPAQAQNVIPPFEDIPALYIQMEDIMSRASASVTAPTYTLGTPVASTDGGGVQIPVTLAATGSYEALKGFMVMLQTNIRPISLTAISFTPSTAAGPSGQYNFSAVGFVAAQALSSSYSSSN